MTVGYAILNNAKELSSVMDTLGSSSGSVDKEMNAHLDSTEAKIKQLKESVTQFWTSFISSDLTKGVVDALNKLVETFGNLPTILTVVTTAFLAFKSEAIMGCIASIGKFVTSVATAGSVLEGLSVAMSAINPFVAIGIGATALITILNKLVDKYQEAHDWEAKIGENIDTLSSNQKATALVNSAKEYQQALQNSTLTEEQGISKKKALLEVQQQLATQFPELISGYDNEGNALVTNMTKVEQAIKLSSLQASTEAKKNYDELFNELNDRFSNLDFSKPNGINEVESAVESYNRLKNAQSELSSSEQERLTSVIDKLKTVNELIVNMSNNGGDISGMQAFDFDTGQWIDAQQYVDSTKNSVDEYGNSLNMASNETDELTNSTSNLEEALQELSNEFDSIQGEISIIDTIQQEFAELGMISDDTANKLISKYPDLLNLMAQESFTMQDLINYQAQLRIEKQNTLNEAVAQALTDESVKLKVDAVKSASDNNFNNLVRQNSATTTNVLGSNYGTDSSNFAGATNVKGSADANVNNVIRQNGSSTANQLAGIYQNDVSNFANAQKAKEEASNQFMRTLFANVQQANIMGSYIDKMNATNDLLGFDKKELQDYNTRYKDKLVASGYEYAPGVGWVKKKTRSPSMPSYSAGRNVTSTSYKPITSSASRASSGRGSGGGSGSSGSSGGGSSTQRTVENVESLTDRYYQLNNELNLLNKNLDTVKNKLNYSVGSEYKNNLESEIRLYRQLKENAQKMINEELGERWELRVKLDAQGFRFDENENITNYAQRLEEIRNSANAIADPDAKERAIKNYKDLSEATKRYAELVYTKIPELKSQMEEYNNSIKEVYKTMTSALTTAEQNIYETAKYYAEKTVNAKKEAIDKQIDLMDKLKAEEEDREDIAKKESELSDIKAEMLKYANDTTALGKKKMKELQEQYETALKDLNDTIVEQQTEAMKNQMESEKENLEDALEKYLDPANIRQTITDALNTGLLNVMDSTYDLNDAMKNMMYETKTSTQELIDADTEWLNGLKNVASVYAQIVEANNSLGNITNVSTEGFKAKNTPEMLNSFDNSSNTSVQSVSAPITITINGNADSEMISELEEMMDDKVNELYKAIKGK